MGLGEAVASVPLRRQQWRATGSGQRGRLPAASFVAFMARGTVSGMRLDRKAPPAKVQDALTNL